MLPFKYDVPELKGKMIEYRECTDIGSPGVAWCAVDPDDKNCGQVRMTLSMLNHRQILDA